MGDRAGKGREIATLFHGYSPCLSHGLVTPCLYHERSMNVASSKHERSRVYMLRQASEEDVIIVEGKGKEYILLPWRGDG